MKAAHVLMLTLLTAGCEGEGTDDPHTDVSACEEGRAFEFGRDVGAAVMQDGDEVAYGTPPQGGAPYAPFEVRMRGPYTLGERLTLEGDIHDRSDGRLLAEARQGQAFFCGNTGAHAGWWFGNEIHLRFSDPQDTLASLEGLDVTVRLALTMADGDVETSTAEGTLVWRLGR